MGIPAKLHFRLSVEQLGEWLSRRIGKAALAWFGTTPPRSPSYWDDTRLSPHAGRGGRWRQRGPAALTRPAPDPPAVEAAVGRLALAIDPAVDRGAGAHPQRTGAGAPGAGRCRTLGRGNRSGRRPTSSLASESTCFWHCWASTLAANAGVRNGRLMPASQTAAIPQPAMHQKAKQVCGNPTFMFREKRLTCFMKSAMLVSGKAPSPI